MSSNTDNTTVAAPVSNNADTEEANLHHVATLVKASKEGTALDASYDAILKSVMENAKSRDALMKAIIDNTKLSQSMVTNFPNAVEITSNDFHAQSAKEPTAIETQLDPPSGTKGFSHQFYKVTGTNWTLDVYAYRHANSDDVTLIVLHSGSTSALVTTCTLWTTPATASQFHYPVTYDSQLDDDRYSYAIDYTNSINMIGPDGKNPIVFKAIYKETFIAQSMSSPVDPTYLAFIQLAGRMYGMSVFNASFKIGTSFFIELSQDTFFPNDTFTGRIQVTV